MSEFSFLYQNHSNFFKQRVHKQTGLGLVAIIPFSEPVPPGWRVLNIQQGRQIKKQLQSMISTWGIVAFSSGKLDGQGYGHKISNTYGNQCGQRFIIYSNYGAPSDPSQFSLSFSLKNQAAPGQLNYVQNQKKYFQSQLQIYEKINTPIGLVLKVPLNLPIPQGFRVMSLGEGVEIKQFINEILDEWSIVAFQQGKIDGSGYGNKISQTYGQQCGQKFIISLNKQFSLN